MKEEKEVDKVEEREIRKQERNKQKEPLGVVPGPALMWSRGYILARVPQRAVVQFFLLSCAPFSLCVDWRATAAQQLQDYLCYAPFILIARQRPCHSLTHIQDYLRSFNAEFKKDKKRDEAFKRHSLLLQFGTRCPTIDSSRLH